MPSLAYPTVNVSGAIIQLNRSYGHMATSSLNADDQRSNPPSISDVSRICCSISYDSITIAARGDGDHLGNHVVQFNFSARDENDHVLENFETQLVLDLLPRSVGPLTGCCCLPHILAETSSHGATTHLTGP
jgi:hypothetical protein